MAVDLTYFHLAVALVLGLVPMLLAVVCVVAVWRYLRTASVHLSAVVNIIAELLDALRAIHEMAERVFYRPCKPPKGPHDE